MYHLLIYTYILSLHQIVCHVVDVDQQQERLIRGAAHSQTRLHATPTHVMFRLTSRCSHPLTPACFSHFLWLLLMIHIQLQFISNNNVCLAPHVLKILSLVKITNQPAMMRAAWVVLGVARPISCQAVGAAAAPITKPNR